MIANLRFSAAVVLTWAVLSPPTFGLGEPAKPTSAVPLRNPTTQVSEPDASRPIPANLTFTSQVDRLNGRIAAGDVEGVRKMLEDSPDVATGRDTNGITPLNAAVKVANKTLIEILLNSGVDVNIADGRGQTPLHCAIQQNLPAILEVLFKHNPNVNARDQSGRTPLWLAVFERKADLVKLLLAHHADPTVKDLSGATLAEVALAYGGIETFDLLKAAGADGGFFEPVYKGDAAAVKAALAKDPKLVDSLNWLKETPLLVAVEKGHLDVARLLMAGGADVNVRGQSDMRPLHYALGPGKNIDMVKLLLEHGAKLEAKDRLGRTPIWISVGRWDEFEFLTAHGADINAQDVEGHTMLFEAAVGWHNIEVAEKLLKAGANPDVPDKKGQTLRELAEKRFPDLAELLRQYPPKPKGALAPTTQPRTAGNE